eukprot:1605841-Pleurochrysis_carterae.AAC.1
MAAVRAMAIICESSLWTLLRAIGSDAHILDVLPTMWPTALAFFVQAAATPATVVDGSLQLVVEGVREERSPLGLVEQLLTCSASARSRLGPRSSSAC